MERNYILFYQEIERKFAAFTSSRQDIRAAFVMGSRARNDHPADQWSDMDILFYAADPAVYLTQQDWIREIGDVLCSFVFQTAGGDPEILTLFQGGYQVDFVIHDVEELRQYANTKTVPSGFYRGVRVITDKDNLSHNVLPTSFHPPKSPPISQDAYTQITTMFWFVSLYMAKQLLRGELWTAKMRDFEGKGLLLQMIEWHERTTRQTEYDTWHAGRFLSEWASSDTYSALSNSFGRFDTSDSWKALISTTDLFQSLSADVGQKMNYIRPEKLETFVSKWIKEKSKTAEPS